MATLTRDEYRIGWICALHTEYTAARAMLDEKHTEPEDPSPNTRDENEYTLGRIGKHNIVIGVLPSGEYGTAVASSVATNLVSSFPSVRIGLMVGIGGGAPIPNENDIRLGDIVVSNPSNGHSGVMQYDYGKAIQGQGYQLTRVLNQPPQILRAALVRLRTLFEEESNGLEELVTETLKRNPRLKKKYQRPDPSSDRLFRADVLHSTGTCGDVCAQNPDNVISRPNREEEEYEDVARVHYGLIATANTLMKDARDRDRLAHEHGVMCFEMEAGGLMNSFPCLVVRGICDYSDSHKNKEWQGYAAMTAAGFARALILRLGAPAQVERESKILEVVSHQLESLQTQTSHIISDKHSDDMRNWLNPPDPSTNYTRAQDTRHKGSGQWLLDNEDYKTWKNNPAKILWLKGKAGCGKTILSSTVIQDLQCRTTSTETPTLIYFYFAFSDSRKQSLESLVRSLLHQLYHQCSEARGPLDNLYETCRKMSQPSQDELVSTLQSTLLLSGCVWVVLDALDESSTCQRLLAWIARARKENPQVRLLITSRPEQEIEAKMSPLADIISLQSGLVDEDIAKFVHDMVHSDDSLSRWKGMPDMQERISSALVDKADGMFRWVSCQLDSLKDCLRKPELEKALNELPKTLDETYDRILKKIMASHRPQAITILQLLCYSDRPIRVDEAVDAITVSITDKPRFDKRNRLPVPDEISRYCEGLIIITGPEENKTMQLSHFSVKQWLSSDHMEPSFSRFFKDDNAHASISQICLAYTLELPVDLSSEVTHSLYPFASYAVDNWARHAAAGERASVSVTNMALELLGRTDLYQNSLMVSPSFYHNSRERLEEVLIPPLVLAAFEGLHGVTERLLESGVNVNQSHYRDGSALVAASRRGHEPMVRLLLKRNADINASGGGYGSALLAALDNEHDDITKLLLTMGANPNAQRGWYATPLSIACRKGGESTIRLLLEKGASINAPCRQWGDAVQAASSKGRDDIVQLLLDKGAHADTHGGLDGSALIAASKGGFATTVNLLLHHGANVNAAPDCGEDGTALQVAVSQGHEHVTQLLLENGADPNVNAARPLGDPPLELASRKGNIKQVAMLLAHGASINTQDWHESLALQIAAAAGNEDAVLYSIENGADINTLIGMCGTALQFAAAGGKLGVVRLLLRKGADVNQPGWLFGNALTAAVFNQDEVITKLLLDNGADVNARDFRGYTSALRVAVELGSEVLEKLLRDRGATL